MASYPELKDRVALITGAAQGIGAETARLFAQQGCKVAIVDIDAENGNKVAADITRTGNTAQAFKTDITDVASVEQCIAGIVKAFGGIDILVHNAGGAVFGALEELDDAEVERNLELNFIAPLRLTRAVLPLMRAQRRGHVVSISAGAALGNYPGFSAYGAAKLALEGAMESLAQEARPFGIAVTLVQPGPFRTEFLGRSTTRAAARLDAYDATSGKFLKYLESIAGRQPGDPVGAARAILTAVNAERPPLRLVLGKYAVDKARRRLASAGRELDAWAETGAAADFASGS